MGTLMKPPRRKGPIRRFLWPDLEGALIDTPQRWGILPTRAFWRDPQAARVSFMFGVVISVPVFFFAISFPWILHYPYAAVLGSIVYSTILCGFLERYIRKKALERREQRRKLPPSAELPETGT